MQPKMVNLFYVKVTTSRTVEIPKIDDQRGELVSAAMHTGMQPHVPICPH